jgi:hypothetical protein
VFELLFETLDELIVIIVREMLSQRLSELDLDTSESITLLDRAIRDRSVMLSFAARHTPTDDDVDLIVEKVVKIYDRCFGQSEENQLLDAACKAISFLYQAGENKAGSAILELPSDN